MAVSEETCINRLNDMIEVNNSQNTALQKLSDQIEKLKSRMSKVDPDLATIANFNNQHQVEGFRLYKRAQVRLKLLSSIVKITGIVNALAGFIATLAELIV